MLESHLQIEQWKPAGQHNLIWDIQISSLLLHHIWRKLHLWTISTLLHMHLAISSMTEPHFNLNNNLISYRHTVIQFTHLHLAARTHSVRIREGFTYIRIWDVSKLNISGYESSGNVILWEQCVSQVHCLCLGVFFATQWFMDYICICPLKIPFTTKKRKTPESFSGRWEIFFKKCAAYKILNIFSVSPSIRGQLFQ